MRRLLLLASCLTLLGCTPNAAQILAMGDWSTTARQACQKPGACPVSRACIAAVYVATLQSSGRTEYLTAQKACAPFISAAGGSP